jgi:hypothetical protein
MEFLYCFILGFFLGLRALWGIHQGRKWASNTKCMDRGSRRSIAHCAHYTQEVNLTVLQRTGHRTHID